MRARNPSQSHDRLHWSERGSKRRKEQRHGWTHRNIRRQRITDIAVTSQFEHPVTLCEPGIDHSHHTRHWAYLRSWPHLTYHWFIYDDFLVNSLDCQMLRLQSPLKHDPRDAMRYLKLKLKVTELRCLWSRHCSSRKPSGWRRSGPSRKDFSLATKSWWKKRFKEFLIFIVFCGAVFVLSNSQDFRFRQQNCMLGGNFQFSRPIWPARW